MSLTSRVAMQNLKLISNFRNCRQLIKSQIFCRHFTSKSVLEAGNLSRLMFSAHRNLCSSEQVKRPSLASFLTEEIEMESAAWREREAGRGEPFVAGFDVSFDGAMVTLSREYNIPVPEKVTVKFNVSGSVSSTIDDEDTDEDIIKQHSSSNEAGNMDESSSALFSRPEFTIDVQRKNKILSFLCSFINPRDLSSVHSDNLSDHTDNHSKRNQQSDIHFNESMDEASDSDFKHCEDFQINEFAVYEKDLTSDQHSKIYSAECSVIDGELYDYLLEFLEKRGIDDKFAVQVVRLSTLHEHNCYVKLLRDVRQFIKEDDAGN